MQETPVVTLPQDQRRHNGYLLLAILILVALVLVAAVLVARPDLLIRGTASTYSVNPELIVADRFLETHPEARFGQEFLRENPEVRAALIWELNH